LPKSLGDSSALSEVNQEKFNNIKKALSEAK
ncbi:hypothetical protein, partial [Escherichia coli]